ncbi:alpha/beta hydrolase [Steroidobacter sp. S1-65]|uniref:Alpha/beta hydrolase n=1 Tax=Steroidobacter gossypii TaxID=2805490 RepID=A0ABS1WUT7_9GAMM|nr:alpha/beta hydrolase [Steroidobacter gossypii]MBM0104742.1 alpha/beta hydrolase [Steroidobacter gossypii]
MRLLTSIILLCIWSSAQAQVASIPAPSPTVGFRDAAVGGETIRYMCQGAGSPTVIVEQGGGISLETVFSWKRAVGWAALAPKIAAATRICVYDRVGLGRSSKAERARTSFDIAAELHALLAQEKIAAPYVLAGQSLGGMNALAFATQYRAEVVGLLLVDSSHPQQLARTNAVLPARGDDESDLMRAFREGPDRTGMGGEWFDFAKNSARFEGGMSIGTLPLVVLTRAPQSPDDKMPLPRDWQIAIESVHQQLQRELAGVSMNSKHIVARKAGHNIQLDEPQLVLDAIMSLIEQSREGDKQ